MRFFDTHVHVDLLADAASELAQANSLGISHVLAIGLDPREEQKHIVDANLVDGPLIFLSMGIHPQTLTSEKDLEDALRVLREKINAKRPAALAEIGLDARKNMPDSALQEHAYRAQIRIAQEYKLPICLHGVRRDEKMLQMLQEEGLQQTNVQKHSPGIVWHGFSGSRETMEKAVELGILISIGFAVLLPNVRRMLEAVPAIPDDHLLLETDAPPLALPRIIDVARRVAELKNKSLEEITSHAFANALRLFDRKNTVQHP